MLSNRGSNTSIGEEHTKVLIAMCQVTSGPSGRPLACQHLQTVECLLGGNLQNCIAAGTKGPLCIQEVVHAEL